MTTKDEALRLALEAFKEINKLSIGENAICLPAEIDTAMDAIKKALEQPEPPCKTGSQCTSKCEECAEPEPVALGHKEKDKYEFVPTAKWFGELPDGVHHLYTSPPKREWQGLTGQERYDILSKSTNKNKAAARVEAKLKEKNT